MSSVNKQDEEKNQEQTQQQQQYENVDEKRQGAVVDEKYYSGEAKGLDARRFALQSAEDDRKASYFRVVFGFFFFLFFNLLAIANLVNDLEQLFQSESGEKTQIESSYPNLVPSAKSLLALNIILLVCFIALVFATLKLPKTTFNLVAVATVILQIGKVGSAIAFLGGNTRLNTDFRNYIKNVSNSDVDQCAGDNAPYCQAVYTWSFSYYETIIDIVFGSILAAVMLYFSNREKQEILARSVRVLPTDEKELSKVVAAPEAKSLGAQQAFHQHETQYGANEPRQFASEENSPEKQHVLAPQNLHPVEDIENEGIRDATDPNVSQPADMYASKYNAVNSSQYNDQSVNDSKLYFNPNDNSSLKIAPDKDYKNQ